MSKVAEAGNRRVMLTERGTFFGYNNLVVDFRSIPLMKESGCPVVMDATHSVQRPERRRRISGGDPQFIPMLAAAGITAGADGIFLEVHPRPGQSPLGRTEFPAPRRAAPTFNPPAEVV